VDAMSPDDMRIGWSLPAMIGGIDRDTVLAWCRRIEADGYSTIGFGERIAYQNLELFSVLSAAAAVTERVRIMSSIVVLPLHAEVWVAKQSATLDVLSGGRYTLGVGVGGRNEDYRAVGASFDRRFDRLDQQVGRIRDLWSQAPPGDGLDPVGPRPVQQALPILSGAMGPKSIARSARWADGIAGFEMDPSADALQRSASAMTEAWDAAGRDEAPYRMTSFWCALGPVAEGQLQRYAYRYLSVFGDELAAALARACTAAGPDAIRRAVDAARAAGFDEIQLVPTTTDVTELDRMADVLL
jgi:alkanesulfonate monooxygenase SsuD/methylene tetrahydromethanopterin reductase-like flavin-dependent oxidoreductase (luciferase family)